MTDEHSTSSAPPPPDRVALQKAARDAAIEAMQEWERTTYRRGWEEGWKECNDHWIKMLNEATQQTQANALRTNAEVAAQVADLGFGVDARGSQARASDVVLDIIKSRPGLRGIEIVKATGETGPAIHERTVRTALHRMKRDKLIKVLDGRWFATGHDPEGANAGDGGENDG